jgi:peptidoglycan hydrolase FlgJ
MDPISFPLARPPAPDVPARALQPGPAPARSGPEAEARIAREFEAVFLGTIVEEMLKTGQPATFGGGHGEEMWRSFLARAFADQIAQSGGIGVATGVGANLAAARAAYGGP